MTAMFVYVTAADAEEARQIGLTVVRERLAACANVLGGMTSIFRWRGAVEESTEAVLIMKTENDRLPQLIDRVKALHSYESPCVVAMPIAQGDAAFLHWIRDETREGRESTGLPDID